jgi:hypothetical protein
MGEQVRGACRHDCDRDVGTRDGVEPALDHAVPTPGDDQFRACFEGWVFVAGRNEERGHTLVKEISDAGGAAHFVELDIVNQGEWDAA